MKTQEKTEMITKSRLKSERGWTDKLIKEFLPVPDATKPNPNYKNGPPMLLFAIDRINNIEETNEFKALQEGAAKRKESAKKAVETKLQQLWTWLNTLEINVPVFDKPKLIKRACDHYNNMQQEREFEGRSTCGMTATAESDLKFLERICVNYLRHCLTKYEKHLDDMSGKVGFGEGYEEIRRKIFLKISENYIWLADECKRQQVAINKI
jgi:hypothetical protein